MGDYAKECTWPAWRGWCETLSGEKGWEIDLTNRSVKVADLEQKGSTILP
jgi:hypothetical protein